MDKINGCSEVDNTRIMERDLLLNRTFPDCALSVHSVSDMKIKMLEFSKYLTDVKHLSLSQCDGAEYEEILSHLFALKKDVKDTIGGLLKSQNKNHEYICGECKEPIYMNPYQNFWTCLQNHEHVEYMFSKFLNSRLNTVTEDVMDEHPENDMIYTIADPGTTSFEFANENTDSGIDNELCDADHNEVSDSNEKCVTNEGVNSFRFNFVPKYDEAVANKIYPDRFMKVIRKIDRIREFTVQLSSSFRAVCLLCQCDLITKNKTKISRYTIEDHCLGQRHLRFATNAENINILKKYHELFLSFEVNYQAHQVFFKPTSRHFQLQCILCYVTVNKNDILPHINGDTHKKKVLDLLKKNVNSFNLTELQVQVYGVAPALVENKEKKPNKERTPVKAHVPRERTESEASPSSAPKEVKHNIIKSVENSMSKNFLDLIPHRFGEHLKHLNFTGDLVYCNLCKFTLPKNVEMVKKHLRKSSHIKASNIKQIKYSYYCEICNIKILDEAAWDSHFTDGPNKHANMAESRKSKTTEYECTKCFTVIYGDDLSLTRHLSINGKREKKSKELKLPEPVNKLFKSKAIIQTEANKLAFEANDALKYNELTTECCNRLETVLRGTFEGCKAYPFGSRISGLGDQYSDLDVFIDTGGMYTGYKNQDPVSQVQLVRKVASLLSKHKEEFQDVFQIPTARTPIVKLFHLTTEIECDLSFRHALSVENTKFIRFCLNIQPITQPFILLLKKWSQHNNFTEHISTYALALMAIFYLQVKKYLLSVKRLRELNPKKSLVINGWETINYTMPLDQMKTYATPYPGNVSDLLKDFFAFYAKFKYQEEVICPLMGHAILKKQFHEKNLPPEMKSYLVQLTSEEHEQFRALSPMCIQDPFDLSHNLTKACQPGTLNKFKAMCDLTFKRLESFE